MSRSSARRNDSSSSRVQFSNNAERQFHGRLDGTHFYGVVPSSDYPVNWTGRIPESYGIDEGARSLQSASNKTKDISTTAKKNTPRENAAPEEKAERGSSLLEDAMNATTPGTGYTYTDAYKGLSVYTGIIQSHGTQQLAYIYNKQQSTVLNASDAYDLGQRYERQLMSAMGLTDPGSDVNFSQYYGQIAQLAFYCSFRNSQFTLDHAPILRMTVDHYAGKAIAGLAAKFVGTVVGGPAGTLIPLVTSAAYLASHSDPMSKFISAAVADLNGLSGSQDFVPSQKTQELGAATLAYLCTF